jgi:uncharacterized membrane protein YfcA
VLELGLLAVLGLAVGAFGTLVGAGGGFLLVPILLLLYPDEEPDTITAMSLLVVFANAASGSVAYAWQRRIDFYSGGWFALATLPGSHAGEVVVGYLPRRTFDALFALVLGVIGAYLLLQRQSTTIQRDPLRGRGVVRRTVVDREGQTFVYAYRMWQGMAISLGVGFVSSLLGIGGGIVHVPAMAIVLHFPVHIATATSHFVLAIMALQATGAHIATGSLGWDAPLARAAAIGLGAVGGAQAGARLAHRVHGPAIIRVLGAALAIVAVRLALVAAGV